MKFTPNRILLSIMVCLMLLLSIGNTKAIAQSSTIDSLYLVLKKNDKSLEQQVSIYSEIAMLYWDINIDSAQTVAVKILELSQANNYEPGKSKSKAINAMSMAYMGKFEEAEKFANEVVAVKNDDESVSLAYSVLGSMRFYEKEDYEAIRYLRKSLTLAEAIHNKRLLVSGYSNMGLIYMSIGDAENAEISYQKSIEFAKKFKDYSGLSFALLQLGVIHLDNNQKTKARKLLLESLSYSEKYNYYFVASSGNSFLAEMIIDEGQFEEAKKRNKKAFDYYQKAGNSQILSINVDLNYARIYLGLQQLAKAKEYAENAFNSAKKIKHKRLIHSSTKVLLEISIQLNDNVAIEKHYKVFSAYTDSLIATNDNIKVYNEIKKLELEILEQDKNFELAQTKARNRYVLGGLFLLSVLLVSGILYDKNRKLVKLNKFKSEFLSIVSHEMKTPLNSIMGFSKLLGKTDISEKQPNYLGEIDKASKELLFKIKNVLQVSSLEKNQLVMVPEVFNIYDLGEALQKDFQFQVAYKNLEFEVLLDEQLKKDWTYYDGKKLKSILEILLENAVKFTSEGTVGLAINRVLQNEEEIEVDFQVYDTGKGISKEKLSTIFNPFYPLESSRQNGQEGMGLGLSVAKKYVTYLGGQIKVDTKLGESTKFQFQLKIPLAPKSIGLSDDEKKVIVGN